MNRGLTHAQNLRVIGAGDAATKGLRRPIAGRGLAPLHGMQLAP